MLIEHAAAAINQIPEIPVPLWFILTLAIGIAEGARIQAGWSNPYEGMENVQRLKPEYVPGSLGFDPLGLKPEDPEEFRIMQEKELSHGRLAMLAAAGFLAQETITQQTWLETLQGVPGPTAMLAVSGRQAPRATKAGEFCFGLPGNIAPAGNWDPLNLLEGVSKDEVMRRREAELTHGRVSMLAALGFLVQESFHPLFGGQIGGPAIKMIPEIPVPMWFVMTLAIGIAESARIQAGWANPYEGMDKVQRLKAGYTPGDLGFDPLGLKPEDPEEFRIMQEKELSHGRLAMIAAAGFLAQETITQQPWLETLIGSN